MIKPSKVVFVSDELEDNYNSLPEDDFVKKSIVKAVKDLKYNAFAEIHVPKRLIPKEYNVWLIYSRLCYGWLIETSSLLSNRCR